MIVLGLDPGTKTSPTGLSIIEDGKIVLAIGIMPPKDIIKKSARERIKYICDEAFVQFGVNGYWPDVVGIECSRYQGKANEILNRFIGALQYMIPFTIPIIEINPMSLKKALGSGRLEKEEMANILLNDWFTDKGSKTILRKIIKNKEFDLSDSIAVALIASKQFTK